MSLVSFYSKRCVLQLFVFVFSLQETLDDRYSEFETRCAESFLIFCLSIEDSKSWRTGRYVDFVMNEFDARDGNRVI